MNEKKQIFRFAIRVFCHAHGLREDDFCEHVWHLLKQIATNRATIVPGATTGEHINEQRHRDQELAMELVNEMWVRYDPDGDMVHDERCIHKLGGEPGLEPCSRLALTAYPPPDPCETYVSRQEWLELDLDSGMLEDQRNQEEEEDALKAESYCAGLGEANKPPTK